MPRIAYADPARPELSPLVERIVSQRGELLHLYRMLLHSPPITEGWLALMTAIRQKCALRGGLREMIIIRIAHLNGASYEADQHRSIALREGVSEEQVAALADWKSHLSLFDAAERAVLELADQMTLAIRVDDACWDAVRALWTEERIVELVVTIASYNMVSRVLVAVGIESSDDPTRADR